MVEEAVWFGEECVRLELDLFWNLYESYVDVVGFGPLQGLLRLWMGAIKEIRRIQSLETAATATALSPRVLFSSPLFFA
jgi:hypothetical protein